jgi:hypothetical protein
MGVWPISASFAMFHHFLLQQAKYQQELGFHNLGTAVHRLPVYS